MTGKLTAEVKKKPGFRGKISFAACWAGTRFAALAAPSTVCSELVGSWIAVAVIGVGTFSVTTVGPMAVVAETSVAFAAEAVVAPVQTRPRVEFRARSRAGVGRKGKCFDAASLPARSLIQGKRAAQNFLVFSTSIQELKKNLQS